MREYENLKVYNRYEAAMQKAAKLTCTERYPELTEQIIYDICEIDHKYFDISCSKNLNWLFVIIKLTLEDNSDINFIIKMYPDRTYVEAHYEDQVIPNLKVGEISKSIQSRFSTLSY